MSHQHHWRKVSVEPRCHYNVHHYVCGCGATAYAIIEHLPSDEWDHCPRCVALLSGAVRRRAARVVAITGHVEEDLNEPVPERV